MPTLKETTERKRDYRINIVPPKSCQIEATELIPSHIEQVHNDTPYSSFILDRMRIEAIRAKIRHNHGDGNVSQQEVDTMIKDANRHNLNFLRWDLLRRQSGTGFEGYGAGSFTTAQDIAEAIAKTGVDLLQSAKRYSTDPRFYARVWETLLGIKYDSQAALFLESSFASVLGRLRAETADIPGVDNVRKLLTNLTASEPVIIYEVDQLSNLSLPQNYHLPNLSNARDRLSSIMPIESVSPLVFNGQPEYWGYLFMMRLGIFGHPFVRTGYEKGLL